MAVVTMRELLESGVHFGHQTRRWNPKMKRFIFTERNGIYIIDLIQSLSYIDRAFEFVKETIAHGGSVLFVGTKKQAQEAIAEQATRVGMPYVNQRWLGGMLTNFSTVHKRLQRLKELGELDFSDVAGSGLTKKELLILQREHDKLEKILGGIRDMTRVPSAVWIVDTKKEHIAVGEARKLNIPVVAILDTNCDPDEVDYKIPGNDDAIRSVTLLTRVIADAVAEGLISRSRLAIGDKVEKAATKPLAEWERDLLEGEKKADEAPAAEAEVVAEVPAAAEGDVHARSVTDETPARRDDDLREARSDASVLISGGKGGGPRDPGSHPPAVGPPDEEGEGRSDGGDSGSAGGPSDAELAEIDAQLINFWVTDAPADGDGLHVGHTYTGCFQVGADRPENLASGDRKLPAEDIPAAGLNTTWLVWSTTVALDVAEGEGNRVTVSATQAIDRTQWMAQFELLIPAIGESEPRLLTVAPLVAGAARIDVMVLIGDDVYRELVIDLRNVDDRPLPDSPARGGSAPEESTGSAPSPGGPMRSAIAQAPPPRGDPSNASIRAPSPSNCRRPRAPQARPWSATRVTARRILPAAHAQLRPPHRWQEPGATLTLFLASNAWWDLERGRGDTAHHTWGAAEWNPDSSDVLPNILTAREALDRVREFNSARENTIDPADLSARLECFEPTQDWTAVTGMPTGQALAVGEQSALTHEMRALAFSGSELFDALFPPSSTLREKVDALAPGDNLRIVRSPAGPSLPHVPWPLLYCGETPAAGTAVDPQRFLGMRLRTADLVKTCEADRSLTPEAIRAHLLYWGCDKTEEEARKHRSELDSWSPFFLPTGVAQRKEELSAFLSSPERPVSLIYLFCQCSTGSGAAPVLRFGSTNRPEDVLELMDMGRADLVDQPLVFINACATSAADPNFTNQLQSLFLRRGCRAYIGTECKVPTGFAARFATAFFHFLYLHDSSGRTMAAGEAFAQARKFFWDEYRSLGGLYYSYVNDDRIYVARPEEVAALR